jgi:hypothetical protein
MTNLEIAAYYLAQVIMGYDWTKPADATDVVLHNDSAIIWG